MCILVDAKVLIFHINLSLLQILYNRIALSHGYLWKGLCLCVINHYFQTIKTILFTEFHFVSYSTKNIDLSCLFSTVMTYCWLQESDHEEIMDTVVDTWNWKVIPWFKWSIRYDPFPFFKEKIKQLYAQTVSFYVGKKIKLPIYV